MVTIVRFEDLTGVVVWVVGHCSTLLLVILHIFCYAFDVYAWARTRVNYPFIFGFSSGTELRYREVLLLATGLSTFLLGGMNLHIAVTLLTTDDHDTEDPEVPHLTTTPHLVPDIIPLILVVVRSPGIPCQLGACMSLPCVVWLLSAWNSQSRNNDYGHVNSQGRSNLNIVNS